MHDHATDGGLAGFLAKASARDLRLHLDNAHNFMTSGWSHDRMVERHEEFHAAESERLCRIEAAAELIAHDLAIVSRPLCLTASDGTVYLAEEVDPRHMPTPGPLYRLTAQVPDVDLLEATKASLAATGAYLAQHKHSEGPIPSDAPGGGPVPPAVDPLPAPPSSEEAESAACPAPRPASSGATSRVVDLMAALEASLAAAEAERSES